MILLKLLFAIIFLKIFMWNMYTPNQHPFWLLSGSSYKEPPTPAPPLAPLWEEVAPLSVWLPAPLWLPAPQGRGFVSLATL